MLKKRPPVTLTAEQLIARHRRLGEDHLRRAAKAGRLEAETRHATMATAHATLALSYELSDLAGKVVPPVEVDGDTDAGGA